MRRTSRMAGAALCAALLVAGAVAAAEPDGAGKPVAVFPSVEHDFGAVDRGETLEYQFVVRNEGDAPLEILAAKPT